MNETREHSILLTVASLLSILWMTFHLAGDIVLGMEPGTFSHLVAVPILVVWLYATLVLAGRRSGYVIILLASLPGSLVPVIHMKGAGVGGAIARSSGAFFFRWTRIALGGGPAVSSCFSTDICRPSRNASSSFKQDC